MPAARKVLIVEDEAIFAANVKRFLEYHGWQACIAASGREAVEACSWFAPCVISLDYQLPDMNGFEALETMRRHVSSPCVLVTAHPIEAIRCGRHCKDPVQALRPRRDPGHADAGLPGA